MNRQLTVAIALFTAAAATACSEKTQQDAAETAELAGDDIEANAAVLGEAIEDGAKTAAGAVAEGAADLEQHIEANDKETPGPAPITGDDLNADREAPQR